MPATKPYIHQVCITSLDSDSIESGPRSSINAQVQLTEAVWGRLQLSEKDGAPSHTILLRSIFKLGSEPLLLACWRSPSRLPVASPPNIIGCIFGGGCAMAAVDISDSRITPVRVRRYTRHAMMLTSVKYGSIARYRSGPGTPGANVSTATETPAMSVVLESK